MAVSVRSSGVRRLLDREITDFMVMLGNRTERLAERLAPAETGRLKRSIRSLRPVTRGLSVDVTVTTETGYGLYPERGTGIYGPSGRVITPRSKPFLVFQPRGLGHVIRVRSVKGQPGQHYMRRALLAVAAAV